MVKKEYVFVLIGMVWISVLTAACSDNVGEEQSLVEMYPLNSFAAVVGDSYYHGKIDQSTRRVEIGAINNGSSITGVDYTLISDSATIYPDPATFIGNWDKEQTVTVTTEDNQQFTYTIVLTQLEVETEQVLFMDDFDTDGIPDPDKWVLSRRGDVDWNEEMSESYDQAYVKDGKLILVAEKIDGEYRAGGVDTNGKFDFTFGKVEVRARITQHPNGAFPAIWMMPNKFIYNGWPNCGEIDIMEHIKQEPVVHQTLHTHYTYTLDIKDPGSSKSTVIDYQEWNTYGVEWTEDKLTFLINGVETFSYPNLKLENEAEMQQWPFTQDASFYLILNMGLGGRPNSWAGPIDDDNLPAIMEVDWVKVTRID